MVRQSVTFEQNLHSHKCNDTVKHEDAHENIIENNEHAHNITSKLLRIFKSKKWRHKTSTRNNEIVFDKPLSFPKVKLRKTSQPDQSAIETEPKCNSSNQQQLPKVPLKISKSLPLRKPGVIVWEEIQEFQKFIPHHKQRQGVKTNGALNLQKHHHLI